jgi:hypothetical protein
VSVQPYDLAFFAAGTPVPKGSTKPRTVRNRQGRIVSVGVTGDNQERQDRWSGLVAQVAREAVRKLIPEGARPEPDEREVECVTHFVVPLLPDGGKTLRESATQRSVGDGDKLTRCVWDALTGIVWVDDSQVTQWGGSKRLAAPGEQPGVQVYVRLLGGA